MLTLMTSKELCFGISNVAGGKGFKLILVPVLCVVNSIIMGFIYGSQVGYLAN